jgi:hypothetical protein
MASRDYAPTIAADTRCHEFMDSLVQSLFGIGLRLESCIDADREPQAVRSEIDQSLHALHVVIGNITEHRGANCLRDCFCTTRTPQ